MSVLGFSAPNVWGASGRGFSMATVAPKGHLIHMTGQVAWDANEPDDRFIAPS